MIYKSCSHHICRKATKPKQTKPKTENRKQKQKQIRERGRRRTKKQKQKQKNSPRFLKWSISEFPVLMELSGIRCLACTKMFTRRIMTTPDRMISKIPSVVSTNCSPCWSLTDLKQWSNQLLHSVSTRGKWMRGDLYNWKWEKREERREKRHQFSLYFFFPPSLSLSLSLSLLPSFLFYLCFMAAFTKMEGVLSMSWRTMISSSSMSAGRYIQRKADFLFTQSLLTNNRGSNGLTGRVMDPV